MATKKYRKRKKKGHASSRMMTGTIQPGEVPSDADLDAEAVAKLPPEQRKQLRAVFGQEAADDEREGEPPVAPVGH